eukprot:14436596-Alexandrium_andersonii.AAC.1
MPLRPLADPLGGSPDEARRSASEGRALHGIEADVRQRPKGPRSPWVVRRESCPASSRLRGLRLSAR